jgi:hypothetical protein
MTVLRQKIGRWEVSMGDEDKSEDGNNEFLWTGCL